MPTIAEKSSCSYVKQEIICSGKQCEINSQDKFHAQLSRAWKMFYNLRTWCIQLSSDGTRTFFSLCHSSIIFFSFCFRLTKVYMFVDIAHIYNSTCRNIGLSNKKKINNKKPTEQVVCVCVCCNGYKNQSEILLKIISLEFADSKGWHQMLNLLSPIIVWRPLKGYLANRADPEQMLQNAISDQGLHCLQTV